MNSLQAFSCTLCQSRKECRRRCRKAGRQPPQRRACRSGMAKRQPCGREYREFACRFRNCAQKKEEETLKGNARRVEVLLSLRCVSTSLHPCAPPSDLVGVWSLSRRLAGVALSERNRCSSSWHASPDLSPFEASFAASTSAHTLYPSDGWFHPSTLALAPPPSVAW